MIELDWDEVKRQSNIRKHKIDFADLKEFWENELYTNPDERFDYGEMRFLTFGLLAGEVIAVSHTETEDSIRIISARRANKNEQKEYFKRIRD
jgi:uncharacterized DUF497 family protein